MVASDVLKSARILPYRPDVCAVAPSDPLICWIRGNVQLREWSFATLARGSRALMRSYIRTWSGIYANCRRLIRWARLAVSQADQPSFPGTRQDRQSDSDRPDALLQPVLSVSAVSTPGTL